MSEQIIDPGRFGVSFSLKQCRGFGLKPSENLTFLLKELGFRRFRLMSYWNEHQKVPAPPDFSTLDEQCDLVEKYGGQITLCLGVRQPRWPESHWPRWVLALPAAERQAALMHYLTATVKHFQDRQSIVSWQLENEALNRSFGQHGDFSRRRLRAEFKLVRSLDARPIIMTTSNTWGLPLRQPFAHRYGFTLYNIQFQKGRYSQRKIPLWLWSVRAFFIRVITGQPSFIHELQAEPWGHTAIWKMKPQDQDKSMSAKKLQRALDDALKTKLYPIDLWGGEWWYWRAQGGQPVHQALRKIIKPRRP